jgi:putative heme-binding domain-containing protein
MVRHPLLAPRPTLIMKTKAPVALSGIAVVVILIGCLGPQQSKDASPAQISDEAAQSQRLFQGHCARCHGIQATGGFGPNLAQPKLRNAPDEAALMRVIRNGIPDTAMPGAWQISDRDARQIAAYVRTLGRVEPRAVPGDVAPGRPLYEGNGTCVTCHRIRRQGGLQGPDLTDVGRRRGADYLRQSLLDPGAAQPEVAGDAHAPPGYAQFLPVRVVTSEGREIQGVRLNEDDFTIQLRDAENRLHSLRKGELRGLQKEFGKSPMPSYESVLSASELDDLVAYLASLRGDE